MKRIPIFLMLVLFFSNVLAMDTLNVINTTTHFELLFYPIVETPVDCYPQFRAFNPSDPANYCTLGAGQSLVANSFSQLNNYFPGLTATMQTNPNNNPQFYNNNSLGLIDGFINGINANWSYFIYKADGGIYGADGASIGFSDFYSCHELSDGYGSFGSTATETFTSFTIGGNRYFVIGEY